MLFRFQSLNDHYEQSLRDSEIYPIGEIYDSFDIELDDMELDELLEDAEETEKLDEFRTFCQANFNDVQIRQLLKHIHQIKNLPSLPRTFDEFIDSPAKHKQPTPVDIEGGKYMHIGIKINLTHFPRNLLSQDVIVVKFSYDGVRLHKNSKITMWPIVMIIEHSKGQEIMLVGLFIGSSKPKNANEYFYCLVKELQEIKNNSDLVELERGYLVKFEMLCQIADTPARLFAMLLQGHTGFNSCHVCKQLGFKHPGCGVSFQTASGDLRTDAEYRSIADKVHQKGYSIFVENPFMTDAIIQNPLDCMHGFDLGCMRKKLVLAKDKKIINMTAANEFIDRVKPYIPSDFVRKPRHLEELDFFKASELRTFAIYLGPQLYEEAITNIRVKENFMLFFVSYRLLMEKDDEVRNANLELAQDLLNRYVESFAKVYGPGYVSYNIHNALHMPLFVKYLGPLDRFSSYGPENYYQLLRHWIRKPSDYFTQIYNRWYQTRGVPIKKTGMASRFGSKTMKANQKDSCVLMRNDEVYVITKKTIVSNQIRLVAKKYQIKNSLFMWPVDSKDLDIYSVSELSTEEFNIEYDNIKQKLFRIPTDHECTTFAVIPVLHY